MAKRVAIIGAGVAGVTAAYALAKSGFQVEVFEARDTVRHEGLGIQIGANAIAALALMGLDAGALGGVPTQAVNLHDAYSRARLQRLQLGRIMLARYGYCSHYFARAELVQSIADRAADAGAIFHFGSKVTPQALAREFSLVVNAAGAKSRLTADIRESHFVTWRGLLPLESETISTATGSRVDCGKGFHVVTYPIEALRARNFVAVIDKRKYETSENGFRRAFEQTYLSNEINALNSDFISPLFEGACDFGDVIDGVECIQIGDAAHPMMPFLAQGAGQAIEDAFVMSHVLNEGFDDILPRFRALRQKRAEKVQIKSKSMTNIYHAHPRSPQRLAQKLAFSVFERSPRLAYLPFDWLYKLPYAANSTQIGT